MYMLCYFLNIEVNSHFSKMHLMNYKKNQFFFTSKSFYFQRYFKFEKLDLTFYLEEENVLFVSIVNNSNTSLFSDVPSLIMISKLFLLTLK